MAWTQQTAGISLTASLSLGVTAGDLVCVALIDQAANSTATLSDGVNTYHPIKTVTDVTNSVTMITWWFIAATTTTLTIAATGAAATFQISAGSFRNGALQATPLHADNGQAAAGSAGTDADTSLTFATTAGDLVVGWITDTSAIPAANWAVAGTNYTNLVAATQQDGTNPATEMEYNLNDGGGTHAATWTPANTNSYIGIGASFTAQGAGGGPAVPALRPASVF